MRTSKLTEGKIWSTLLNFAIPFLMASLLQALYGAADLFMVGQFADSAAVSAVASGSQIMQTLTGVVLGISTGGTVLIGRYIGAKDEEGAARAVGTMCIVFAGLALLLTPLMTAASGGVVTLMQMPAEAVRYAKEYLFICSCGIPFIIGYNAVSGIFRGMGDSRTPVYFIALACMVNIGLDYLLVARLHMAAAGAAAATITAQAVSFLAALFYMVKRGLAFPFGRRHLRFHTPSAVFIFKVGCPLALQDALVNMSFLIITAIVNSMGVIASASVGVVEKILGFAMLPPGAFSSAVATMTAQNIGAGKPKRALRGLQFGILYSLIFGVIVFVTAQITPETITSIFTTDRLVVEGAARYFQSFSIDCMLVAFVFNMNAYFSGCGRSVISMVHSLLATFCVRIPVSYFVSRMEGSTNEILRMLGFAVPMATAFSLAVCTVYFIWQKKRGNSNVDVIK